MFNEKIWERAREIVSRGDVTELTTRVYKQIVAEAKLHRLEREIGSTRPAFCEVHQFSYIGERCPLCPTADASL